MKSKILIAGFIAFSALTGCEKLLDPDTENLPGIEAMYQDTEYARGLILSAYLAVPGYYDNSEYATDDAVTNDRNNNFLQLATGSWTSANNPFNVWNSAYSSIEYLNLFLQNSQKVTWSILDPVLSEFYNMKFRGEAYGLRAMYMYYLLRNHGGYTADGQLAGVPILTEFVDANSSFNTPRSSFEDCIAQIYKDLDSAEAYLPVEYGAIAAGGTIPARFSAILDKAPESKRREIYNYVMGDRQRSLFNGLISRSFRARTALLAASPAFLNGASNSWHTAADAAAVIIDHKGGVGSLPATGGTYYANDAELSSVSNGVLPPEYIWSKNLQTNTSDQEALYFPPSLFGSGRMNPTQNLVDAFPMLNGYPIDNSSSGYDAGSPYTNRDPRLARYIVYDGSAMGINNTVIRTGSGSGTDDGLLRRETSTRTGYYMKKRLRMDVNPNPASTVGKNHLEPRIRYTEMYLNYAEAANEAWGPTGTSSHAYSAYDVIKAIRRRAGIGLQNGDAYLEECASDKNKMRELIRNERRIELSFESFRFWDLRRWKLNLNQTARGLDVDGSSFTPIEVERRSYQDYMYYGPLPLSEVLKYSNLKQNAGW
ncbi:RagB/SusD family nutrient uptake outer membrane protein [Niabella yanshanensis]|uniref:RagB/SusD family nutrient uptake outer membrane protein n=1 Tax=Niabella yanshanensis TaxID=577386 RepID=A0ABZ0W6A0_9BACT|nr:RagB/SusD family nutrient uptake outer membrane protein [Niabella yanshanensis]WQD38721.1 RagB/SusD family nutrient uptake outer membrane protein [Niabella yanshanensis]